jgi:hypothetical protein
MFILYIITTLISLAISLKAFHYNKNLGIEECWDDVAVTAFCCFLPVINLFVIIGVLLIFGQDCIKFKKK